MPPIKTGVEAFWDNKNFQKGFGDFMRDVNSANKAAGGTAAPIGAMGTAATGAMSGLGGMGAMAVAGGIALVKLAESAIQAVGKLIDVGKSSILAAARVEELTLVMQFLGQRAGYSQEQLTQMTNEIRAQGIQTDIALGLMAQFARFNLDMGKASDLAAVAQNAAVLSMENSSEALEGLMYGIITYNQRILRTHGINLDVSKSFEVYAQSIGKTAEALTEQEKVQATLNGVIAAGANIEGVYATAQQTAGKQARSLSRYIFDLKAALGAPFLSAFSNVIQAVTNFVKSLTKAVSEGGRLFPIMSALGAIASFVTEGFKAIADAVSNWLAGSATEMSDQFAQTANDAISWGANIAINLATGLIQGAAAAITAAINWIANLITGWLKPGSPPKILPNIDKYGAATMSEYLNGFTKADFSALDAIQGSLKSVFGLLVDQGKLAQKEMGPLFAKISKDIIKAIATGTVNEDLFKKIRESGGKYGKELEQLARDQIALAQAENQVKDAEKALDEARKREAETGKQINVERMKYNRMLRSGASAADLKAQLAKVNAAEAAHETAVQDVATAEKNLDTAQTNIDVLKEQAALQQQILEQMLEIAQAQVPQEAPGGAGGAGGGAPELPGLPEMPGGEVDLSGIEDKFKDAVDRIRQNIIDKLKDVWADLVKLWNEKLGPAMEKLRAAWERFKTAVSPIVDFLKAKWEAFKNWLMAAIPAVLNFMKGWWNQHKDSILTILGAIWQGLVTTATNIMSFIVMLWTNYGTQITTIIQGVWDLVVLIVRNALNIIGDLIDLIAAIITGDWEAAWTAVKDIAVNLWQVIIQVLTVAWNIIKLAFTVLLDYLIWYWTNVWNGIKLAAETIWKAIQAAADAIWGAFVRGLTELINGLATALSESWNSIKQAAETVWNAILALAESIWPGITGKIQTAISDVQQWLSDRWDEIKSTAETVWNTISDSAFNIWADITGWIKTAITDVQQWLSDRWNEVKSTAETVWNTISTTLSGIASGIVTAITGVFDGLFGPNGSISGFASKMVQAGKDLIQGLIDGVGQMAGALLKAVTKLAEDALNAILDKLGIKSPSKVMMKIGVQTVKGLEQGIKLTANLPRNALNQAVNSMIPPSTPVPVMAGPNYRSMNMTNNIYPSNNMDAMALGRFIEQTVIRAMRR